MNTKVLYMYRDGANYKIHMSEIVKGEIPENTWGDLDEFLYLDEFYPGRVGFRDDTFVDLGYAAYDDDPDSHELIDFQYTEEDATVKMTADEFVEALKNGACLHR